MNKFFLLLILVTLPAFAQDSAVEQETIESETVAVPDMLAPSPEAQPEAPPEESVVIQEAPPEKNEVIEEKRSESAPVLAAQIEEDEEFRHREGHWISTFSFESMRYDLPFEFTNARKKEIFSEGGEPFYGGRLGFGREFYIGAGITTTSRVEGYYNGTVSAKRKSANPDVDVDLSYSKLTGQALGVDASQSLGYIFESKTKNPFMDEMTQFTIEPFIEAGIGVGQALSKASYSEDTGTGANGIREEYRLKVQDNYGVARIGAGFNVGSKTGFFMFARVTQNRYEVFNRKQTGYFRPDPGVGVPRGPRNSLSNDDVKGVKIDPITVYTFGGGYKF